MLHSSHILNIIMRGEGTRSEFRSIALTDDWRMIKEVPLLCIIATTHYTTMKRPKKDRVITSTIAFSQRLLEIYHVKVLPDTNRPPKNEK